MKKKQDRYRIPISKIILRTMKLTLILVALSIVNCMASVYSQKVSLNLNNVKFYEAINEITRQTKLDFAYSKEVVDMNRTISISATNIDLKNVLDRLLEGTQLMHVELNGKIYFGPKEVEPVIQSTPLQQQKKITGAVIDAATGEALTGVNVFIPGTTIGTITDASGKFSLQVTNTSVVLQFSFIGYVTQKVALDGQKTLKIALTPDVSILSEVVVIGYGKQKRVTVTGAMVSVGSKDLVKSSNASVANTLAGRVTGFTSVQYSGQPGGDDPMGFVRGVGSLTSGASLPLILVDGVERPFTQIDPNVIESVTILKDASATAVFGVRGANGVVIVTTKRGAIGAPKISFTGTTGFQKPSRLPVFANSYTHATMYDEAQLNDDPNAVLRFSPAAIEAYRTNSEPIIYPNTDWVKYILKPAAFQTQENFNISGGTNIVNYFVSFGYLKQDGLFRTFDADKNSNYTYNRYNYQANLDINVTKTTKVSLTTGERSEVRNEPLQGEPQFSIWRNIYFAQPYRSPGIIDGKHIISDSRYIPGEGRDALNGYYGLGYSNSVGSSLNFDINLNQNLDIFTKGLSFRVKGSYNSYLTHGKVRHSNKPTYFAVYLHDIDPTAPDDKTVVYKKGGDGDILGYSESFNKNKDWYFESAFSYDRIFGNHHVTGLLLYNETKSYYPSINIDIPRGYVGLVGRATYDFKSKYLLDLDIGYNGSENFAPGRRFGFFPAVSMGWILTEERFMKNIPVIEFLKLRGSYGIVGNDKIGSSRFLYLPNSYSANAGGYSFGTDVPQNQIGAAEGRVGNPLVTWEKSRKQDYGLEIKMLKGRLGLVADYFYEHRSDILTTRGTVPGISGINLPVVNIGVVDNHGYEIELKWQDKINGFGYAISPNMSFARNKIIYMDEVHRNEPYLMRTGNRVNQPIGYVFDGFWTEQDLSHFADFPNAHYSAKPGDLRYKDLNGDKIINADDRKPIGYPDYPEYVFGLSTEFNYKNFDLNMLWTGATNVSRAFSGSFQLPFGPTHGFGLMQYFVDGRWTPETAATATLPRLSFSGTENNTKFSDFWLKNASYLRLKNLEFGYSFKTTSGVVKRMGITKLRIFVNGYNLLTLDKLKVIDPESVPSENAQYPLMKNYNFGMNITF